jgi:hypothetical protein
VKLGVRILREEHRLRESKKRLLGRIFEPKRNEVIRFLRKLHKEELHKFYSSPSVVMKSGKMSRACTTHGSEDVCM